MNPYSAGYDAWDENRPFEENVRFPTLDKNVKRRPEGDVFLVGADFGTEVCVGCDAHRDSDEFATIDSKGRRFKERITGHKLDDKTYKLRFLMCGPCFRKWKKWAEQEINGACPHRWILKERKERADARERLVSNN